MWLEHREEAECGRGHAGVDGAEEGQGATGKMTRRQMTMFFLEE